MIDQLFSAALEKYGIMSAIALYIFKTLWDLFSGNLFRYIKAIEANTLALEKLTKDMHVAFFNIKEVREKTQMGPISKLPSDIPDEVEQ